MHVNVLPAGDFGRHLAPLSDLLVVLHRHTLLVCASFRRGIDYLMEILLLNDLRQRTQGRVLPLCLLPHGLIPEFAVHEFAQNIVLVASKETTFSLLLLLEQCVFLFDEQLLEVDKLPRNLLLVQGGRLPTLGLDQSQFGKSVLALLRLRNIRRKWLRYQDWNGNRATLRKVLGASNQI